MKENRQKISERKEEREKEKEKEKEEEKEKEKEEAWGNPFWFAVMIFFVMSLAGWIWEVGLHLISSGSFVNRGFLHGPWLPIYGCGSVMIWMLHNKLPRKPLLEFSAIILLCGCIEYGVSWFLEQTYGMRWWDYSDYFLNLNGRICVEGLLAFGIGGMAFVHLFVPLLDRLFRRIPKKILVVVCLLLILIFCGDLICSGRNPNLGTGIAGYR